MASSIDSDLGFRSRRRRRSVRPMSEINVTPFVDVMLVLLIVFMVTAPLLSAGVPIDLPDAPANPLAVEKEPITVTVDSDGRIFIAEQEVTIAGLVPRLNELATAGPDERIYVRGDRASSYGVILQVMGTISVAGFTRIGLISDPDASPSADPIAAAITDPVPDALPAAEADPTAASNPDTVADPIPLQPEPVPAPPEAVPALPEAIPTLPEPEP